MADTTEHEPHGTHQSRKAAASGWSRICTISVAFPTTQLAYLVERHMQQQPR